MDSAFGAKWFVSIYIISCCILCASSAEGPCDPWNVAQYPPDKTNVAAPVEFYQTGPGGRPLFMKAVLKKSEKNKYKSMGSPPDQKTGTAVRANGYQGDQAGHLLAARLGGSGKDQRNLFPQNGNCNMGSWNSFPEGDIAALLENNDVEYSVKLLYKDDQTKRPYKVIACYAAANKGSKKNEFQLDNPIHPLVCTGGPSGPGKINPADFKN